MKQTINTIIKNHLLLQMLKVHSFFEQCFEHDLRLAQFGGIFSWHQLRLTQELAELTPKQIVKSQDCAKLWFKNEWTLRLKSDLSFKYFQWNHVVKFYVQVNNYEIVANFFYISHNLTWYSAIVHKFTRIYPVCSTYELTKQFM